MFLADTALSGAVGATRCGLDYFGAENVVFASDFPFDAEGGSYLVRETIKALDALELTAPSGTRSTSATYPNLSVANRSWGWMNANSPQQLTIEVGKAGAVSALLTKPARHARVLFSPMAPAPG